MIKDGHLVGPARPAVDTPSQPQPSLVNAAKHYPVPPQIGGDQVVGAP